VDRLGCKNAKKSISYVLKGEMMVDIEGLVEEVEIKKFGMSRRKKNQID